MPIIYGDAEEQERNNRPNLNNSTSTLSMLGGRAAIKETLQMYLIGGTNLMKGERTVPVEEIEGVSVAAHPFTEMLKGKDFAPVALADYVPHDRFFVHFSKPTALPAMLDAGSPFLSHIGTLVTANDLNYYLEKKYLAQLGMTRETVDWLLQSGLMKEFGVYTPDLFFIEGTDITVVARVKQGPVLDVFLKMIGLEDKPEGIRALPALDGGKVYWAAQDDMLIVGTSVTEVSKAVALAAGKGKGSLGQSAEFRYMLHKMPEREDTAIYAYFSDPFIRRLTSPEVKIGQLRRAQVIAAMEAAVGAALLRRVDGFANTADVGELASMKYLPKEFLELNVEFAEGLVPADDDWGRLDGLMPLSRNPVQMVTEQEKELYDRYRNNYTRYWRRFFDPIAIRFDHRPGELYEVSTFILPLIDNSIYNNLREVVQTTEEAEGDPLRIPQFAQTPVLSMSINLKDKAWIDMAEDFFRSSYNVFDFDPRFLDLLGPEAHIFVLDSDPILRIGGGDLLGAFTVEQRLRGNDPMFMVPVLLSLLTRPCDIAVELSNPELAKAILANASTGTNRFDNWFRANVFRVTGEELIVSFNILNAVNWDIGLRVEGDYLIISNHPWTGDLEYTGKDKVELSSAALSVHPEAMEAALAASFGSAMEKEREATFRTMAHLLPWLENGAENPEEAAEMNRKVLGFRPMLPRDQNIAWNGWEMASDLFGSVGDERQPGFDKAEDYNFGLFRGIKGMRVQMQLEDDGLRSIITWEPVSKPEAAEELEIEEEVTVTAPDKAP